MNGCERRRTRVLVADGRPEVRDALRLLFEQECDLVVVAEASGAEAVVARAADASPDLILLDWDLRSELGEGLSCASTLIGELRTRWPGVGVVALGRWPEVRTAATQAGAHAFVSKVDPPERVLEALRTAAPPVGRA